MPIFHLFTQMRIILDHHVRDHFSTQRNLNKRIWVFWAPVLEKKSNRILKNIVFAFWFTEWFFIIIRYLWMLYFINSRTKLCQTPLGWTSSPKIWPWTQRVKQGTLPLQNDPEKRNLFFNTMVCSSKELGTRISANIGPFP